MRPSRSEGYKWTVGRRVIREQPSGGVRIPVQRAVTTEFVPLLVGLVGMFCLFDALVFSSR